jgi:hypothetical protein
MVTFAVAEPALLREVWVRGLRRATAGGAEATYIRAARASAVVAVAIAVATVILFPPSRSMTSCRRW